jgi:hypothetical protein
MSELTQCPECHGGLGKDSSKCRCGWVKPTTAGAYQVAGQPRPICRSVGCAQPAMNGFAHCRACEDRLDSERARKACEALGLHTLEQKKAYVRRMMREVFAPPSFDRWAQTIKQGSVDFLVRSGGKDDGKVLDRLRALGVIDGDNKLIPLEKRAEVRAAHEAKVRAERERIDAMLKAQGVVRPQTEVQA